jgi:hypothetical protein
MRSLAALAAVALFVTGCGTDGGPGPGPGPDPDGPRLALTVRAVTALDRIEPEGRPAVRPAAGNHFLRFEVQLASVNGATDDAN